MKDAELVRLAWGKKDGVTGRQHPLFFHMHDVAAVTLAMWDSTVQRGFRHWVAQKLGLEGKEEAAGLVLAFWAATHDLGKATPAFQNKERGRTRHGVLTAALLESVLHEPPVGYPANLARQIAAIVGGHHGVFPRSADLLRVNSTELGGRPWQNARHEIVSRLADKLAVPFPGWVPPESLEPAAAMALAGLVSVADWIASSERFFPYAGAGVSLAEYVAGAEASAKKALELLRWDGWTPPHEEKELADLFACVRRNGARPLQTEAVRIASDLRGPGLVIIEAPMGEGKTEAAMFLADHWARVLGQRGCYFALPTQATSNQMFGRVKEFLGSRYSGEDVNLMLLHGHAALSAEFELLRKNADALLTPSVTDDDSKMGGVLAAEWFTHRKRGLLAPFGVGTVDQALLAVLQTRHVFVRLFGLANKTVIIDEVHAYDAYMSTLLERLLEWLAAVGSSVVLLSATLPKAKRKALMAAYALRAGEKDVEFSEGEYPLISWTAEGRTGVQKVGTSDAGKKTVHLLHVGNDIPELGQKLRAALAGRGCAAVICNTVGRAQEVYQGLKAFFPEQDGGDGLPVLDLLHARYLFCDREEREQRCLTRFGKTDGIAVRRPRRAVLVATQIIEQSLDLDFDLMVSEWAPADLLLQRAGRLHRHKRVRPRGLERPTLWLCAPEQIVDGVPDFGKAIEYVYHRHVLLRTWLALNDRDNIAVPEGVSELIEAVYGAPSAALPDSFSESAEDLRKKQETLEWKAKQCRILPPYHPDDIVEDFNRELEEDNPAVDESIQALTRVCDEPSVSVVFLYGDGTHCSLDAEGRRLVDLKHCPNNAQAAVLLRRSLTISRRGLAPLIIQSGHQPSVWRQSALLRHHRLMFVNRAGNALDAPSGYSLELDANLGLVVSRLKKEEI